MPQTYRNSFIKDRVIFMTFFLIKLQKKYDLEKKQGKGWYDSAYHEKEICKGLTEKITKYRFSSESQNNFDSL
jgi:hypothetical protein